MQWYDVRAFPCMPHYACHAALYVLHGKPMSSSASPRRSKSQKVCSAVQAGAAGSVTRAAHAWASILCIAVVTLHANVLVLNQSQRTLPAGRLHTVCLKSHHQHR